MRIATFNVNGVNRRLANLLDWMAEAKPDIVCLQELKCAERDLPRGAIEAAGYGAVWAPEPRWNGVAILARDAEPVLTRTKPPADPADAQARYVEAAVRGVLIASLYAPNGNPQPEPKFAYKLAWTARLEAHADELRTSGAPVALAGDWNIGPEPREVYPTRSYDENALTPYRERQSQPSARLAGRRGRIPDLRRGRSPPPRLPGSSHSFVPRINCRP